MKCFQAVDHVPDRATDCDREMNETKTRLSEWTPASLLLNFHLWKLYPSSIENSRISETALQYRDLKKKLIVRKSRLNDFRKAVPKRRYSGPAPTSNRTTSNQKRLPSSRSNGACFITEEYCPTAVTEAVAVADAQFLFHRSRTLLALHRVFPSFRAR